MHVGTGCVVATMAGNGGGIGQLAGQRVGMGCSVDFRVLTRSCWFTNPVREEEGGVEMAGKRE